MSADVRLFSGEVAPADVRVRAPAVETGVTSILSPVLALVVTASAIGLLPSPATPSLAPQTTTFVTSPVLGPNDVKVGVPPVAPGITAVSSPILALVPAVTLTNAVVVTATPKLSPATAAFVSDRYSTGRDIWLRVPPDPNIADVRLYGVPDTYDSDLTFGSFAGVTFSDTLDLNPSLALTQTAGFTSSNNLDAVGALGLAASAAMTPDVTTDYSVQNSLAATAGWTPSTTVDVVDAVSLGATATFSGSLQGDIAAALGLPAVAGFVVTVNLDAVAQTTLAALAAHIPTNTLDALATSTFVTTAGWIPFASLEYDAFLDLSTTPSVTFTVVVDEGILPPGIPSEEAFGTLTFTLYLNPPFVPTDETFGTPTQEFIVTSALISPPPIPSEEAFGVPTQSFVVDRP